MQACTIMSVSMHDLCDFVGEFGYTDMKLDSKYLAHNVQLFIQIALDLTGYTVFKRL